MNFYGAPGPDKPGVYPGGAAPYPGGQYGGQPGIPASALAPGSVPTHRHVAAGQGYAPPSAMPGGATG